MKHKNTMLSEMDSLREIVEEVFEVNIMDKRRVRNVVDARMVFAKILRDRGYSYPSIAEYMHKDHSTVLYYVGELFNVMKNNINIASIFKICLEEFMKDREEIVTKEDRVFLKEINVLREQVNGLLLEHNKVKALQRKYERLDEIITMLDQRVEAGKENLIKRKINEMLNGL